MMKRTLVLLVLASAIGIGSVLTLRAGDGRVTTRTEPTTRLYVRTVPPGATVKIDGKSRGNSDRLFEMPAGRTRSGLIRPSSAISRTPAAARPCRTCWSSRRLLRGVPPRDRNATGGPNRPPAHRTRPNRATRRPPGPRSPTTVNRSGCCWTAESRFGPTRFTSTRASIPGR